MCLSKVYSERTRDRWRAKAKKEGYLWLYKTVKMRRNKYCPEYFNQKSFRPGLNIAPKQEPHRFTERLIYRPYFHCFISRKAAQDWTSYYQIMIKCLVAPEWIECAGKQSGKVLVCRKIFMPTYPKKRPLVKDFRAALIKDRS